MINQANRIPTQSKVIWDQDEKISKEILVKMIMEYLSSAEFKRLEMYGKYYEGINPDITGKYLDRRYRNKTPNNYIPTAYYSTVVDTMSGYMFSNVQYIPDKPADKKYAEALNELFKENNNDIKEMKTGVAALAYNKGIELVYTTGDGIGTPAIKYANIDPRQVLLVWNQNIEPDIVCGVRITKSNNPDYEYNVDVIYKDEWQFYYMKSGELSERKPIRELFFDECPFILYNAEMMNDNSPYQTILPYIDALDYLVSGNSNEVERLVDAILVLGKKLKPEDKRDMSEWKVLEGMAKEGGSDRSKAEYITKDMSPQFREYVSKLLINEIHKHSHVIDWYSPDQGLTGEVSAKAMITRLFDMDMDSRRKEKIYKEGSEKRVRLVNTLLEATGQPTGAVKIVFNRTTPDDFEAKAAALNLIAFISDKTKLKLVGLDPEEELELLKEQKEQNMADFNLGLTEPEEEETEEEVEA